GGKNSLNRLIRCVCGKKIGPDPRNFNQRVSLGRHDLLIRTFLSNTGNVSFRVIAYGACKDNARDQGRGCRERYYIMPGTKIKLQFTDISNSRSRIGIWHGKQFITVK
ncbi:EcpB family pilus assembly chaperone, partial [Citrobacter portucalensis]